MTGRYAAEAVGGAARGRTRDAAPRYERAVKRAFYGRLRHRQKLMTFLERKPARFDVLFRQLEADAALRRAAAARPQRVQAVRVALSLRAGGEVLARRAARLTRADAALLRSTGCVRLVCVLLAITVVSFLFMHAIPGDPVALRLGEHASPQEVAHLRAALGPRPALVRAARPLPGARSRTAISAQSVFDAQPVAQKLGAVLSGDARADAQRDAVRDRRRHPGGRDRGGAPPQRDRRARR